MAKQTHPLAGGIGILAALALLFSASAGAELRSLGDSDLDDVVGQAGISISASLNLQENPSQTRCAGGCGARLAIQPAGSGNNYLVIDDISGKFSFDEVTLDVVTIKDGFGGDGAAFNRPVLRVGLKDTSFQDLRFTIAGANKARGTDPGLVQTKLVSARIDGTLKLQGNVNIFTVAPR
ncbi:hypothetical protein IPC1339_23945 [Pseudomonas aeruginosa]|uniref:DUF6160 family protein n=1 Tax=Pseudomonas aeruginosa TaxID=287 RepID=UPI00106838AC|nr:DUF6160 family protein [Pseudomonas aeruginosa]MCJ2359195.1 hypothetical protein [Pseudomonas aeruginosa]MCO2451538.1 hypothetical protein [Pseudomonas aeruginosa]MDF5928400.1 hypothetical protein [Pseudomonas aeruginosa]MDX4022319.1 hypothetical protein [Pseudomonas aeruginosa]TEG22394.1 hypothetical protein IPC1340_18215 [Pseudomonas aeruginosa]